MDSLEYFSRKVHLLAYHALIVNGSKTVWCSGMATRKGFMKKKNPENAVGLEEFVFRDMETWIFRADI